MRPLIVAIAIIIIILGLLIWSGQLDSSRLSNVDDVPAQAGDDAEHRFDVETGAASDADAVTNEAAEGP